MRLDDRKEHILDFVVRDFIRTAVPVSSGRISKKETASRAIAGSLAGSPATIRNIMLELNEDGYLYQPHTSAGRVPTEKGYRYFVDTLMEIRAPEPEIKDKLDAILENLEREIDSAFEDMSRALSGHLKLFSGIGFLDEEEKIFGKGLSEVLKEPEFEEHGLAAEFADFAEHAENILRDFGGNFESEELNQRIDIKKFGSVSISFKDREFGRCVMFSLGPKRMNYERAASTLKYAAKDIKKRRTKKYG